MNWLKQLKYDPVPKLLASRDKALLYVVQRDLLEKEVPRIETIWELPEAVRTTSGQQPDGSWRFKGNRVKDIKSDKGYDQLETYRVLGLLVEKYGMNSGHDSIRKAADFLFRCQAKEGDFRGIYGNQYSPNYSAAIMELLIKAGYRNDPRIGKGFKWLLDIRQNDGGWAIPLRTRRLNLETAFESTELIEPDKEMPSSSMITGVVLRAFAAHPEYRRSIEARKAGTLLKSKFFKADRYPDRKSAAFWTKLKHPFWFNDIVSSLDSLSLSGFPSSDPDIQKGLNWLAENQSPNGLWKYGFVISEKRGLDCWVTLAVCRVLKRFAV